jgi:hypothetical protein
MFVRPVDVGNFQFPAGESDFYLLYSVQTGSGVHLASSNGYWWLFPRG